MKKIVFAIVSALIATQAHALDVRKITDKKTVYMYREWKIGQAPLSSKEIEKYHEIQVKKGSKFKVIDRIPAMITEFARTYNNELLIKVFYGEGPEDEKWRLYKIDRELNAYFVDIPTIADFDLTGDYPVIVFQKDGKWFKTGEIKWQNTFR